jgi:hypothetical protein
MAIFILSCLAVAALLTSCNISMNMVHTSGTASDVFDEDQTDDPDVSTDISLPLH